MEKEERLAIVAQKKRRYGIKKLSKEENKRMGERTRERIELACIKDNYWKLHRGGGNEDKWEIVRKAMQVIEGGNTDEVPSYEMKDEVSNGGQESVKDEVPSGSQESVEVGAMRDEVTNGSQESEEVNDDGKDEVSSSGQESVKDEVPRVCGDER